MKNRKINFLLGALLTVLLSYAFMPSDQQSPSSQAHYYANLEKMKTCIDACNHCAAMCNDCASSCLKEKNIGEMARCIQLCMECAEACTAASHLMSLGSDHVKDMCRLCADICKKCSKECAKFTQEHCKKCAEACDKAAELCSQM
jgi:hypothetical protein